MRHRPNQRDFALPRRHNVSIRLSTAPTSRPARYPEYPSAAITHFAKIDETSSTHGAMNSMIDTDSTLTAFCQTIYSPDFDSDAH